MEESSVENAPKGWRKSLDYWRTRSSKLKYEIEKLREDWTRAAFSADYEKKEREKLKVEYDKLKEEYAKMEEEKRKLEIVQEDFKNEISL